MKNRWDIVYPLMIALNCIMTTMHGFGILTWQHWVWVVMLVLCFIAGQNCREEEI